MTDLKWDAVYRSVYESKAFWDIHWISKARDLYECARRIEPDVIRIWENRQAFARRKTARLLPDHYQGVYFMLLSFAVENLLKAAAISKNGHQYKREFRAKRRFPKKLTGHDLIELAKEVGLVLKPREENLLRRLKRSAVWDGRYPVPMHYAEMSGEEVFLDGKKRSISWFGSNDIDRLNTLILGLPARLNIDEQHWKGAA
jgi:hypothetical protein